MTLLGSSEIQTPENHERSEAAERDDNTKMEAQLFVISQQKLDFHNGYVPYNTG